MSFIQEAALMLDAASKANGATRLGWLVLAKGSVSAAITEATKGQKSQDGHTVPGQTSIEDFAGAPIGAKVTVDGSGVVLTPADEMVPGDGDADGEKDADEPGGDAQPETFDQWRDNLPHEASYEALEEHKRHVAADPSGHAPNCVYCEAIATVRERPEHGRPDSTEDIPRVGDSRGIPDGAAPRCRGQPAYAKLLPISVEFPEGAEVIGYARTAKLRRLAWRWLKVPA